MFKSVTYQSLTKQVDGNHYKGFKIEPAQFISENHLEWRRCISRKIFVLLATRRIGVYERKSRFHYFGACKNGKSS